MKGYKVFNPDWTCKGFRYKTGETYETDKEISMCEWGFHFCKKLVDCFRYYSFNSENKVAEVEALGSVLENDGKFCTNKIKIVRELSWREVLDLINTGADNTGMNNTGVSNAGDRNTGNNNTGDWNTGDYNSGDCNTGSFNIGGYNVGNHNMGGYNVGDHNTGSYNVGCFCENSENVYMDFFDKPSNWTLKDWITSYERIVLHSAPALLGYSCSNIDSNAPVIYEEMRKRTQRWWDCLTKTGRDAIRSLPNFDAAKFERIMWGINIGEEPEPDNDGGFTIDSVSSISVKYDNGTVAKWEWDNTEA